MIEEVILVDTSDVPVGTMEKMEAHRKGLLHRAFSVFVFNSKGQLLLQQRALNKYHSGGLWTNTCCSHPRPGEDTALAAQRRLKEEMGLTTPLALKTSFVYKAAFDNLLTEHEYDYIFTGVTDLDPVVNTDEAAGYAWVNVGEIKRKMKSDPADYTAWFKIAMERFF